MKNHSEHEDNLPAYALGALSELEAEVLERHLMGCERCRSELARLREGAALMPRAVEPLQPPARLKRELMETVRAEAAAAAGRHERRRRPLAWLAARPGAAAAALASALALAALAGFGLDALTGRDETRTVAGSVERAELPRARAQLVLDEGEGGAVLRVEGMPVLRGDRVYQLWLRHGDRVESAGVFAVTADGTARAAVPPEVREADALMVTRERAGGVPAPTEDPVVTVELS